jgi:hypothetical protein
LSEEDEEERRESWLGPEIAAESGCCLMEALVSAAAIGFLLVLPAWLLLS